MKRQGRYGPAHIQFVQQHRLAAKTDALLSALLFLQPPDPSRYFQAAHDLLRQEFSEGYALWLKQTAGASYGQAPEVSAVPRPPAPYKANPANLFRPEVTFRDAESPPKERAWALYGSEHMDPRFQAVIEETSGFGQTYPAKCNGKEFSLQNEVHWRYRLATLFLHKIGRDSRVTDNVKSSRGHYEYETQNAEDCAALPGLPNVKLINELRSSSGRCLSTPHDMIVISASELDAMVRKLHGPEQVGKDLGEWPGWSGINPKVAPITRLQSGLGLQSSREIFGSGEFRISWQEVCALAETTKIYTGADLPPKFFLRLAGVVSRDNVVEYYYHRKAIPLAWMATSQSGQQLCGVGQFIADLLPDPKKQRDYGFRSTEHFKQTIQQSLTELSTQVCVSGQGHFFVGNDNQIQAKPDVPVTFLSAPGIDFNAGAAARTEMNKYFLKDRFRPGGREAFKARVKRTYHILFTACQDNGVTHPTALAIGLGVFMPPIEEEEVKRIYHEAQFELLSDNDYGFDTYFLNPARAMNEAKQLLADTARSSKPYAFKCRLVIHSKDGKALASRLAHEGYRTSFLNPSDCIAVMQGCIGYWWECGMGERYVGEEDFCATSTAILKRSNICPIWSAYDRGELEMEHRVKQVRLPEEQLAAEQEPPTFRAVDPQQTPYWQADPTEQPEKDNPPRETALRGYEHWYETRHKGISPPASGTMVFYRLLWVDTKMNHSLHLRPMVNQLRQAGIWVDVACSTADALAALDAEPAIPINCVLTSLFERKAPPEDGAKDEVEEIIQDSGHHLLRELHQHQGRQSCYFRTVCASTTVIKSHERSTLYSEGCNHVTFDLHKKDLQEVLEVLCFVQRYSDRLCRAIASPALGLEQKLEKRRVVDWLLKFGIDVNFAPKAWAPLHFLAQDPNMDIKLLEQVLAAEPQLELGTRYATDGVPRGATPLYVAVARDNLAAVELLLERGASPVTHCLAPPELDTPMALAKNHIGQRADRHQNAAEIFAKLKEKYVEPTGVQNGSPEEVQKSAQPSKWHNMLTVLWVSTSGQLSPHTHSIRLRIDLTPSLVVQSLACEPDGENEEALEKWIKDRLYPFLGDVGMDGTTAIQDQGPLAWLQCVVLELTEPQHLPRWLRLREAIVRWVEDHSTEEAPSAPWLKIVTYAEGFQAKHFEDTLVEKPWLVTAFNVDVKDLRPADVVLNATLIPRASIGGELLCACGAPPTAADLARLYGTLCEAVTHWSWDGDGDDAKSNPVYPDVPYNARTSQMIEEAYRKGAPSCRVTPNHNLYFREMFQRSIEDPTRVRLVFRYPHPCWDCDAHVRAFPSLLTDITSGNCLVFIGAGFCMLAGGPSWKQLLELIAEQAVVKAKETHADIQRYTSSAVPEGRSLQEMEALQRDVQRLVAPGADVTQFEYAAQQLEDALRSDMKDFVAKALRKVKRGRLILKEAEKESEEASSLKMPQPVSDRLVMASRINYIQCLNFSAVLTTNYSRELCICDKPATEQPETDEHTTEQNAAATDKLATDEHTTEQYAAARRAMWAKGKAVGCGVCRGIAPLMPPKEEEVEPPYLDIVRKMPGEFVPMPQRPIIQIHGSVCNAPTIVLSREGYRSLLHGRPNYRDFLKSVMMSRTILYLGFSFTDDYLNEIRSDVMTMKKHSPDTKNLAYAIIDNKNPQDCKYYAEHEGVKFLTWPTAQHGYGVMDRYLDSLLNMTDTCAALSGAMVVLFSPPDDRSPHSGPNQNMMKLKMKLERQNKTSPVRDVMPKDHYQQFHLTCAETLQEVERALKMDNFLQSWVVTFADPEWDSIPMIHRELIHFLWHPHARLKTTMYPPTLLVWADEKLTAGVRAEAQQPPGGPALPRCGTDAEGRLSLGEQYERNLHVHYCTKLSDVMERFRKVKVAGAA